MHTTPRKLAPFLLGASALLTTVVLGVAGAASASASAPSGPPVSSSGPAGAVQILSASLSACHGDPLAANRYAIFASQMTSIPGTVTMAVNFQLDERKGPAAAFAPVSAPGFGVWVSSQPGIGIYTYNHEVTGLPAPAAFRVLVKARWFDRHHHIIRKDELVSPACVETATTPNLAVGALTRTSGSAGPTLLYSVVVRNEGNAAAGPFQVALNVGGVALPDAGVSGLAAGAKQVVEFTGPRCAAGATVTVSADPGGSVAEPGDSGRTKAFPCLK